MSPAMRLYRLTYHLPYSQPSTLAHYPLAVRSEVEAASPDDASDIILARHTDRDGRTPHIIAMVLLDTRRPLPHRV